MSREAPDYSLLDVPEVLTRLFHPRPEVSFLCGRTVAREVLIPVAPEVELGARFYEAGPGSPTLLFFHGNGEIVADYEDLGPIYGRLGLNFFPVDYRGYGRSGGRPTVAALMADCHPVLDFIRQWLMERRYSGPLIVMGRSLGSAPALELAARRPEALAGLILESGFALAGPLLALLGVDLAALGFKEDVGFRNLDKIARWTKPLLVIHAEFDHIIPFGDGQALFDACPSPQKTLLRVPGANHNDLLAVGFAAYLEAVRLLAGQVAAAGA